MLFKTKTDVPMVYNLAKNEMKKIAMVLIAMIGLGFVANAQTQDRTSVPGDNNNTVIASVTSDNQTSSSITIYNNSTKSLTVQVTVYNDQNNEVGSASYDVSGAPSQGNHSTTPVRLSKIRPCSSTTSGCETKRIKIKVTKVRN